MTDPATARAWDPGQDEIQGVVWDAPDGRGGWISEAYCWLEGCHVKVQGYDRDEVARLLADHHETFHGGFPVDEALSAAVVSRVSAYTGTQP